MPSEYGPYNFRYESQRHDFYADVIEARREVLSSIKNETEREEISSALRVVFSIGAFSAESIDDWGKKDGEQGAGAFRGYRSFRDLRLLRSFLFKPGSGPWSQGERIKKYETEARLVVFKRRGKRVTGEKIYATFAIVYK